RAGSVTTSGPSAWGGRSGRSRVTRDRDAARTMRSLTRACALMILSGAPLSGAVTAQPKDVFIPALVYRTGPYSSGGIPVANGLVDYYTLVNERDGGINGVKVSWEECEFQYDTKKGIECYDRLKGK